MREKRRNGRVTTETSVEDEIAHLRGLDLKGLRARWQSVLQGPAPGHLPRHLLFAIIAYHPQPSQSKHFMVAARTAYIDDARSHPASPGHSGAIAQPRMRWYSRQPGAENSHLQRAERACCRDRAKQKTALLPAPFWCTYAWNRPTSTRAGGSDPFWLCWRGKP